MVLVPFANLTILFIVILVHKTDFMHYVLGIGLNAMLSHSVVTLVKIKVKFAIM